MRPALKIHLHFPLKKGLITLRPCRHSVHRPLCFRQSRQPEGNCDEEGGRQDQGDHQYPFRPRPFRHLEEQPESREKCDEAQQVTSHEAPKDFVLSPNHRGARAEPAPCHNVSELDRVTESQDKRQETKQETTKKEHQPSF